MLRRKLKLCGLGLLVSSIMFPGTATVATGLLVIAHDSWSGLLNRDGVHSLLFGTAIGAFACSLFLPVTMRYGRADGAVPSSYGELEGELAHLRARVEACCPPGGDGAFAEVRRSVELLDRDFVSPARVGLRWLLGTGYVDLWRRLHDLERALLKVEPAAEVVGEALRDRLRLESSAIPQAQLLIADLRRAVAVVSPAAADYMGAADQAGARPGHPAPPPARPVQAGGSGSAPKKLRQLLARGPRHEPAGPPPPVAPGREAQDAARAVLAQVRGAIADYRDDRRSALVRGRNNLFATVIFTGVTSYVLLAIVVIRDADATEIAAAATFYLVGAIVGLFKQLRDASAADTVLEEDYGLAAARLIHTPLFSGLAALGGVVATTMLATIVPTPGTPATTRAASGTTITTAALTRASSSAAPAKTPSTKPPSVVPLSAIFDLGKNPAGIIIAAIFGLTPNLLIVRLQRQVEQYKADLKSSSPGEGPPPPPPPR